MSSGIMTFYLSIRYSMMADWELNDRQRPGFCCERCRPRLWPASTRSRRTSSSWMADLVGEGVGPESNRVRPAPAKWQVSSICLEIIFFHLKISADNMLYKINSFNVVPSSYYWSSHFGVSLTSSRCIDVFNCSATAGQIEVGLPVGPFLWCHVDCACVCFLLNCWPNRVHMALGFHLRWAELSGWWPLHALSFLILIIYRPCTRFKH